MNSFWSKASQPSLYACWEWQGSKHNKEHGRIKIDGHEHAAHRLAYELMIGAIPSGTHIHHECRNPGCVNPMHLKAMTHAEHMTEHAAEGVCKSCGCPLTAENKVKCRTLICQLCKNAQQLAKYQDPAERAKKNAQSRASYHRLKEARQCAS